MIHDMTPFFEGRTAGPDQVHRCFSSSWLKSPSAEERCKIVEAKRYPSDTTWLGEVTMSFTTC